MTALALSPRDRNAVERWMNEGGGIGESARSIERRTARTSSATGRERPKVIIVGAGVAGLETLLALRALVEDRVDITVIAPERTFVNRSMSAAQPFHTQRVRGVKLEDTTREFDAHWHRGTVDRIEHKNRQVVTRDGDRLPYDIVVLALGARSSCQWRSQGVLTYQGGDNGPNYRLLVQQLVEGRIERVAFVVPDAPTWPLPLYDLAFLTAAKCAAHGRTVELSLITPEAEPLEIFGSTASTEVRRLLKASAITLLTSSHGRPGREGRLDIEPGGRTLAVDRVVTVPTLCGPSLRGISCGSGGFIETDAHGRVAGMESVFAAGDATTCSIKHGGLAAQQADAVSEAIAASLGADLEPRPFQPVLRGTLLTGDRPHYLCAGDSGSDSTISQDPLWWPPNKLCGRFLAPYLSSRVGSAADVMPACDRPAEWDGRDRRELANLPVADKC